MTDRAFASWVEPIAEQLRESRVQIADVARAAPPAAWKKPSPNEGGPGQGEGGVQLPPEGFLQGLRRLADEHELLLMFAEVQTGCGRTGKWFGYQHFGVTPDVITLAKSLCGGIAGGAMLTTAEIAPSLRPGMHAATFGGNPIAARAGIAAIEMIEDENLLEQAVRLSELFRTRLEALAEQCPIIEEVRVLGLMIGVDLPVDGGRTGCL